MSAISLGVRCRSEPSTSAIIRSTKDWPGSEVMRTTIRSDSTVVPPVTALRSPPDSRMTGADSPVTADSSTDATPSITSPSTGDPLAGLDDHHVAGPQRGAGHLVGRQLGEVGGVLQLVGAAADLARRSSPAGGRAGWPPGPCRGPRRPTRRGCANSTVSHSQIVTSQPQGGRVEDRRDRGDDRADLDDQHHRGAGQLARVELAERAGQGLRSWRCSR